MSEKYKCFLSDYFMVTRADKKEHHCSENGYEDQCGFCEAREADPRLVIKQVFTYEGEYNGHSRLDDEPLEESI